MQTEYRKIESKQELIELLDNLVAADKSGWENVVTQDFLEAMATWLESADSFYKNFDLDTNSENASWQLFADAIKAATVYE